MSRLPPRVVAILAAILLIMAGGLIFGNEAWKLESWNGIVGYVQVIAAVTTVFVVWLSLRSLQEARAMRLESFRPVWVTGDGVPMRKGGRISFAMQNAGSYTARNVAIEVKKEGKWQFSHSYPVIQPEEVMQVGIDASLVDWHDPGWFRIVCDTPSDRRSTVVL